MPEFYTPVTSLLLPIDAKNTWTGMKSVGQLKRERNIRNEVNKTQSMQCFVTFYLNKYYSFQVSTDNLYTPVERRPKVSRPLVIPRALQSALPYLDRPKVNTVAPQPGTLSAVKAQRPAVVLEPREQKVAKLMAMLKTRYEDRTERLHVEAVERLAAHRAQVEAEMERKMQKQKEARRAVSRLVSRAEAIKEAKARRGGGGGREDGGRSRGRGRGRGRK